MLIYLLSFFISSYLIFLSEKLNKNKLLSLFFVIIALLVPCVIAGMRSEDVGTDIKVYVKELYLNAKYSDSFKTFLSSGWNLSWRFKSVSEFEIGFTFLVYIVTKLFSSLQSVLFAIQLIMILPIYFGLKKFLKDKKLIWLGMLIYYFMFFCTGLNLLRQMIGISICFYALSCLYNDEKSDLKYIILIFVASLFHKSSVLAFVIYLVYKFVIKQNKRDTKIVFHKHKIEIIKILIFAIMMLGVVVVFNSNLLMKILHFLNFDDYSGYISGQVNISYGQLLVRIPIVFLFIMFFKKISNENKKVYFFLIVMVLDVLISNLASASIYASRICILFQFFYIVSLPMLIDYTYNTKSIKTRIVFIIAYLIMYWYIIYVKYGVGQVVPYQFYS